MTQFLRSYRIPLLFAGIKLMAHLLTNTNYGLHRDEYLYLELGRHLGWGYMEIPPMLAWIAGLVNSMGAEVWLVRLMSTLAGTAMIFLVGWMAKRLGGSEWAQALACLGFFLAPAFLRGSALFMPVVFNQLMWVVSAILFVELARTQNQRIWLGIGIVAGLGILTKYSIAFLYFGFLVGILATSHRKWLLKPQPYLALGIALLIALPNVLWQFQHKLPILAHMDELARTQLVNVDPISFFLMQLLMLFYGAIVMVAGLVYLFRAKRMKPYRFIGIATLTTVLLIAAMSGKHYYTLGAYPILLSFGGLGLDYWIRQSGWKWTLSGLMVFGSLSLLPYSLFLLPLDQMKAYSAYMSDNFGLKEPLRWENGQYYDLPQDYADMFGWDEMAQKVIDLYHSLPEEERKGVMIQGGSYGHAGAINYFGKEHGLPEAVSFNGSYMIWAPDAIPNFKTQILVDDRKHYTSQYFESLVLVDSVTHPFARDPGYIYYRTKPKIDLQEAWKEIAYEEKAEFNFQKKIKSD